MMGVATREREGSLDPTHQSPPSQQWGLTCLNCGAAISGDYCSACGQRALPPYPTIRELAGDAFSEFSGWDGKFVRSLKLLLFHPGELTHRFLLGKRIQFISPLRLYLTCSFVYFGLVAIAPRPKVSVNNGNVTLSTGITVGMNDGAKTAGSPAVVASPGMASLIAALDRGLNNLDPATRAAAERQLQRAPGFLRPVFRAIAVDKKGFQARILDAMPRAFFVLIPGLALALALCYRRRNYPEHIYFAMHYQAFVFLVLALNPLAQLTGIVPLMAIVRLLTVVTVLVYEVTALRRVYGGTTGVTIAKAAGMAAICMTIWATTMVAVVYWSSRAYFGT
jgi:uncharacterized protein DUF3667